MKITIIGAGAMGSLIGAYLSTDNKNEVSLVNRWSEHVNSINRNGLIVESNSDIKKFAVKAFTNPTSLKAQDLVIVMVKSYQTAAAVKNIDNLLNDKTQVLTLQNGLGNAETLAETLGDISLLAGTITHGATVLGPGHIKHAGAGEVIMGSFGGNAVAEDIANMFTRCGLPARITDEVNSHLWGKVLINVGINALTAICGVNNGWLVETDGTLKLMKSLVEEAESVAKALGIALPYDNAFEKVVNVARITGDNRSSMLQDMDRGCPTEIDNINGAVVRAGERCGIATPCNNIVTMLVKALEVKNSFRN